MSEMRAPRLTCAEVLDLVTEYLEGALAPREHARVEEHLATCPDCTAYVEQMRTTIQLTGSLREDDVPEPVLDELVRAFRDWHGR
jgi:anti-sigma factor RsiW